MLAMTVKLWHLGYAIYLDDVLEAYLLERLMHAFSIWMGYTLGHVVGELMRWSCCTSLMIHILIYNWYMFGTLIDGICLMILHHWYYLINTTIGICLRYMIVALGSWWRHIMSDMPHGWHIGRFIWLAYQYMHMVCILVDAHGWHIGGCTWLSYW